MIPYARNRMLKTRRVDECKGDNIRIENWGTSELPALNEGADAAGL